MKLLSRKVGFAVLMIICSIWIFCACDAPESGPGASPSGDAVVERTYSAMRSRYMERPLNVRTSFSCELSDTRFDVGYRITEGDDEYTATESDENSFSCDKSGSTIDFFRHACYLFPYDTLLDPTETEGEYSASFSGTGVLAFLLGGSSVFSGYAETGCAQLVDDCVFTVHVRDGEISDYNYDFILFITDAGNDFTAHFNISCEVIK